jgi:hypothetical protein
MTLAKLIKNSIEGGVVLISLALSVEAAQAISFNISWTGANGYNLTGMFGYNDSLIGTGPIAGGQLDFFMMEVFQNTTSLGTWQPSQGGPFNFNFNTTTGQFLVGGLSSSTTGQLWGTSGPSVSFASGSNAQAVGNPSTISSSFISIARSTLTATVQQPISVPEPSSSLAILVAGTAVGFGAFSKRKLARSKNK